MENSKDNPLQELLSEMIRRLSEIEPYTTASDEELRFIFEHIAEMWQGLLFHLADLPGYEQVIEEFEKRLRAKREMIESAKRRLEQLKLNVGEADLEIEEIASRIKIVGCYESCRSFWEKLNVKTDVLPEPLDLIPMDATSGGTFEQEKPDHLLIYSYSDHSPVLQLETLRAKNSSKHASDPRLLPFGLLKKFIFDLGYVLKTFHRNNVVIRHLSLNSLRFMNTEKRFMIGEFMSLCEFGASEYNQNIPYLCVKPESSAPECFCLDGMINARTDVYVLGKVFLSWLGCSFRTIRSRISSRSKVISLGSQAGMNYNSPIHLSDPFESRSILIPNRAFPKFLNSLPFSQERNPNTGKAPKTILEGGIRWARVKITGTATGLNKTTVGTLPDESLVDKAI